MSKRPLPYLIALLGTLFLVNSVAVLAQDRQDRPHQDQAAASACSVDRIRELKVDSAESPRDATVALELGKCSLQMGYYAQAHSALSRALRLDDRLAGQVAQFYVDSASGALRNGKIRQSRIFFQKAIQADPRFRKKAAKEAFRQGEALFREGKPEAADARFSIANSLDDTYGKRISNIYFNKGNRVKGTACLDFYRIAAWYCRDHNEAIGLRLLNMAKDHPSDETAKILKSEAARYIGAETVEAVFPSASWKTLQTRSYIGKGVGNGNNREYQVPTVRFGDPVLPGDKLIVETDGTFKIWDAGWEEHESRCEIVVQTTISGEYFYVQGQKDRIVVVTVQRYH